MTTSTSRLAYSDCFSLLDQALADSRGIRIKFSTFGDAWYFRLRLHSARRLNRKDNAETYEVGHPLFGRSIYDGFIARLDMLDDGQTWLVLEKTSAIKYEVESLSDASGQARFDEAIPITPALEQAGVTEVKRRF